MPEPAALPPADPARRRSLVDDLQAVLDHAAGRPLRVGVIVDILKQRGPAMVMLLLSLPFVIPVPLPGLSTPLGLAIMLYGFQVMLRRPPWVPGFVKNRTLSYSLLQKLIGVGTRVGRQAEHLIRPRLKFMLWPAIDLPIGFSLAFCGFFLGLPLPIPFTNAVPAIALILLLLGVIERDGVAIILGELLTLAILAVFLYVCYLFWHYGFEAGWEMLRHARHHAPTTQPTTLPATRAN